MSQNNQKQEDVVSILTDAFFSAAKGTVKFMASPILRSVGLEQTQDQKTGSLLPEFVNDRSSPGLNVSKDANSMLKPVALEVKKILNLGTMFISSNQDGVTGDVRLIADTASLQVNAALQQINESLSDPSVRASLKQFIATGESIAIELEPLVAEVLTQMVRMGMKSGGDILKAMVIISVEMAAAIPGLGTFINLAKVTGSGALMLYQVIDNTRSSFVISGELLGRVRDMLQGQAVNKQNAGGSGKRQLGGSGKRQLGGSRLQLGGRLTRRLESRINTSIQQFTNPINQTIRKRRRVNTQKRRYR